MERTQIKFSKLPDRITAGEELYGEIDIVITEKLGPSTLVINLLGRESIKLRTAEENSPVCSDSIEVSSFFNEEVKNNWGNLSKGKSSVNFLIELKKTLPASCEATNFNDTGKIFYVLKAKLISNSVKIATTKFPIIILPRVKGTRSKEINLQLSRSCFNNGSLLLFFIVDRLFWKLSDKFFAEVFINSNNCKAQINTIIYELWKKITLRDKKERLEQWNSIIVRKNESISLSKGGALLDEGKIHVEIDLPEFEDKINNNVSTKGELFACEYYLRIRAVGRRYCFRVDGFVDIPIVFTNY
ncbi:hypothetical protein SteCoe_14456 [Stentor coeruleus]|uniref:Arrestin-like N-terminal domain-containing protein n=1 Tax=Stentor coeruleus TaxID=5963 RepID=A0A1R2C5Z8_9CILI|nr:hypothetical protein SteCoe_14456 [Stentor coeruleus]